MDGSLPHSAKPLAAHRARKAQQGIVRVEVSVSREDAPLIRQLASALGDPERRVAARRLIAAELVAKPAGGLKALLAAAPLEGIDLERDGDMGRDVEF